MRNPVFVNGSCNVSVQRPGIAQATMVPVRLKNQTNPSAPVTDFVEFAEGRTAVGGTQWAVKKAPQIVAALQSQRPGLARPMILPTKK